ncbi:GntR family transcriptional regulator [Oceanobacillus sp. FSL W7-1293]|uniref:GntR family transcriptional regulator n=1 Tax=Oceanobacillus sp. FSL W7-1293 TaxID=2921699 RepID=UPI0030CB9FEE
MDKTKRLSTTDYIYEQIKKDIIEFTYEPNGRLVEDSLAKKMEISRTPLRQALYRLELEGLIIKKANGRMAVAPMSMKEAKELFMVREVMEGLIAREATLNIAQSNDFDGIINKFEDITFLMRNSAENERKMDVVSYGSDFHSLLGEYSNNATAVNLLEQINNRVSRYRRLGVYKDPEYPRTLPVEEHEEVLKHMKAKSEHAAEAAMRAHIKRSLKNTIHGLSYLSL